jgi:hypothetical protein
MLYGVTTLGVEYQCQTCGYLEGLSMVGSTCTRGARTPRLPWPMAPLSLAREGTPREARAYAVAVSWYRVFRRTRPGRAPVCWPSSSNTCPLTMV